jgi:hypothetical protein
MDDQWAPIVAYLLKSFIDFAVVAGFKWWLTPPPPSGARAVALHLFRPGAILECSRPR